MNNDLISRSKAIEELNYLKHIGYDNSGVMKLQNMEIQRCISVIEDAPAVEPFERIGVICEENCGYRPKGEREFIEILAQYVPDDLCTYPKYRGKPYYSIRFKENGEEFVGFGTYKIEVLSRYLQDYFMKGGAE